MSNEISSGIDRLLDDLGKLSPSEKARFFTIMRGYLNETAGSLAQQQQFTGYRFRDAQAKIERA